MRVLVSRSRRATEAHRGIVMMKLTEIAIACAQDDEPLTIIHGKNKKGVDAMASRFAAIVGCNEWAIPAEWDHFGLAAGNIRNGEMLIELQPDLVVAFPDDQSKGTTDCINQAKTLGIRTEVHWL